MDHVFRPGNKPRLPARERVVAVRLEKGPDLGVAMPARPLSELAADRVYFNHGLLLTAGGLAFDPVRDAWERAGLPAAAVPVCVPFPHVLFRGMDVSPGDDWGSSVLAAPREYWPLYEGALRAASAVDWKAGSVWFSGELVVRVPDFLWPSFHPTSPEQPTIEVRVFTINGNLCSWGLRTRADGTFDVIRGPADAEVCRFADSLRGESHQPFRAIEPTRFPEDLPRVQLPPDL